MRLFWILTICLAVTTPAWGEEQPLTLEAAVAEVLAQNPDVRAAGYQTEAARARIPQARALDDPMVGVMFEDVPIDSFDVKQGEEINYRFQQKLSFPGKRHVRGETAHFEAERVSEGSRGRIQDVLLDLKQTYYDLYRLDRLLEVNRENQELFRQLLAGAKTAYGAGRTTADPPLKAQVELSKLQNEELMLRQERTAHEAHLKAVLNRQAHEPIRLPEQLVWPRLDLALEEVMTQALENRPELKGLEAEAARDRARLTSARQSFLPDLDLGVEYNQRPAMQDAWTGTAMINVPIYFWKNRGGIREARASLAATQAANESAKIHTRHEIEQAYTAVKSWEEIVGSYEREILPAARTSLKAAQTGYRAGRVDFLTLLDAARTYRELQAGYYEGQSRLGMSFSELERLTGNGLVSKEEHHE